MTFSQATESQATASDDRVMTIRPCDDRDLESICAIVNDGAQAYKGIIPADRWAEPYMPVEKLRHEIEAGVVFWGMEAEDRRLAGVMGIQQVQDVTLIRHAYVRTTSQKKGIGGRLLSHLQRLTSGPLLVGTWADAAWAIRFYEQYGFQLVRRQDKEQLLRRYWTIPDRQVETSVVLADEKWRLKQ
jgi:GNAT superfamily N-acetyltransferase